MGDIADMYRESETAETKGEEDARPSIESQLWVREEESSPDEYTGTYLADRLVRLGVRRAIDLTCEELASIDVGGRITTGVSAYRRVR